MLRAALLRWLVVLASAALVACAAPLGCSLDAAEAPSADSWSQRKERSDRAYAEQLEALAQRATALDLPAAAAATRRWIIPRDPSRQVYFVLPAGESASAAGTGPNTSKSSPTADDFEPPRPPPDAPQVAQQWYAKLERLRTARAAELWELAREAMEQQHGALAYRCLYELLREQPTHEGARRALDDSQAPGPGRGQPKSPQSAVGKIDHPQLGWRKGQYWRIDSPRFRIYTNHSVAAGLDAARRLEAFHQVWRQSFFELWTTNEALAARLQGRDESLGPRKVHEVILFKSRDEYVEKLQMGEPKIALTTGIYLDKERRAFFYYGDDSTHLSWYHEATHQIFQELLDAAEGVGSDANMWALEGVALYCESFQRRDGYCTLGGLDAPRLQFARYYGLRGASPLPLPQLIALGRQALQSHPQIRSLYSQSAGLAQFLLDERQPDQRRAFLQYLQRVYARRDNANSLLEISGKSARDLEAAERRFLTVTDEDLASLMPIPKLRQLSLGRTSVTDEGLKPLTEHVGRLEWLDLSHTAITDDGWNVFASATKLRQLFLERTAITNDTLRRLTTCKDLEELDLSHTSITDDGLVHLAQLKKLKQLYLTGCTITDAGLPALKSLKQLETLDLSDTQVSSSAIATLRKSLPKWQADHP
ncbi:MAG: leucine-rich repeat domain-containing protein [Planctomycetota bacterium]